METKKYDIQGRILTRIPPVEVSRSRLSGISANQAEESLTKTLPREIEMEPRHSKGGENLNI